MADSQAELQFRLTSIADNSGIDSSTASIKRNEAALQELQAEHERLHAQTQAAVASYNEGFDKAAEAVNISRSKAEARKSWQVQNEAGGVYGITNPAEYDAINRSAEALRKKLVVMQAVGAETTAVEAELAKLDAALSTDSALTVQAAREDEIYAQRKREAALAAEQQAQVEARRQAITGRALQATELEIQRNQALAAGNKELAASIEFEMAVRKEANALIAKGLSANEAYVLAVQSVTAEEQAEAVAAREVAAAKQIEAEAKAVDTEATHMNTIAQRELLVVTRELMTGNITRAPGSISILAQNLNKQLEKIGLSSGFVTGVIFPATLAYFAIEHLKNGVEELNKTLDDEARIGNKAAEWPDLLRRALPDIILKQQEFRDSIDSIGMSVDPVKEKFEDLLATINRQSSSAEHAASSQRKLENAWLESAKAAGKLDEHQVAVIKLGLDERDFEAKLKREVEKARAILKAYEAERGEETTSAKDNEALYNRLAGQQATADAEKLRVKSELDAAFQNKRDLQSEITKSQFGEQSTLYAQGEQKALAVQAEIRMWQERRDKTAAIQGPGVIPQFNERIKALENSLTSSTDQGVQYYLSIQRAKEQMAKQEKLIDTLSGQYMKASEAASQADEAAKQAGDAWRDAVKNIKDLNHKIKEQAATVNQMTKDMGSQEWQGRQATWQRQMSEYLGEYHDAFEKLKQHPNDPLLKKREADALAGLNGLRSRRPISPYEFRDASTGAPTGDFGLPPQEMPDIPAPTSVTTHLKKVADAFDREHDSQDVLLQGIVKKVEDHAKLIDHLTTRIQQAN